MAGGKVRISEMIETLQEVPPEAAKLLMVGIATGETVWEKITLEEQERYISNAKELLAGFGYQLDQVDDLMAVVDIPENAYIFPYLETARTITCLGYIIATYEEVEKPVSRYQFHDLVTVYKDLFQWIGLF